MKLVRHIKPVSVYEDCDDENNNELTLANLDSEPGFFKNVIRPMLAPGHEGELINWLKSIGLLPQAQKCKNAEDKDTCKGPMCWIPSKRADNFQWKCAGCSGSRTIRENSVFNDIKCNFKDALRILLGWCKGNDVDSMATILGLRKHVVNNIYTLSAKTADKYLKSHVNEWQMGGPGVLVIVDTYPKGYATNSTSSSPLNNNCPILCLAEVKDIPPKYWFEVLNSSNKATQTNILTQRGLTAIETMVRPGSILITSSTAKICSYQSLQALSHLYPLIVSYDGLKRHDTVNQKLLENLEVIWKAAMEICEETQYLPVSQIRNYLLYHLWNVRFGNESLENLLHQLVN